jgi:hypothetical protein
MTGPPFFATNILLYSISKSRGSVSAIALR